MDPRSMVPEQSQNESDSRSPTPVFLNSASLHGADTNSVVHYVGIAKDEPERLARLDGVTKVSPLEAIGWDEAYCRQWCEENDLLSPIYTTSTRGGCWFCHNQGVDQLRLLRKNYPELWELMLKWDADSPVTFKADGKTVRDYDRRFMCEDAGLIDPKKRFLWRDVLERDVSDIIAKKKSINEQKEISGEEGNVGDDNRRETDSAEHLQ